MLTIAKIVDNDSIGTAVQLSDGSFGIVTHGRAAPSIGQTVERGEFGYLIPVEGTRPHQTVNMTEVQPDAVESGGCAAKDTDSDDAQTKAPVG